eukprot:3233428-Alexandrium_andersonii.AAC.1
MASNGRPLVRGKTEGASASPGRCAVPAEAYRLGYIAFRRCRSLQDFAPESTFRSRAKPVTDK